MPLLFFFFTAPPTSEIYTLSLHDALPIYFFDRSSVANLDRLPPFQRNEFEFTNGGPVVLPGIYDGRDKTFYFGQYQGDRKSTRLNSSHTVISYAVFCLKKKKKNQININHI